MECQLSADPKPTIEWFRDDTKLAAGGNITMRMDPKGPKAYALTLEIKNVGNADAGSYKIVAKNDLGESNATIKLNFDSKQTEAGKAPHFTQKPIIKQPQKNQLTMTCNLESSSQPVIKWFREATEIKQGGRYTIQTTKDPKGPNMYIIVLTIKDPAPADGGVYKCVASNENGESNANITLNFQDTEKTEPAGKAPNFTEKPKIAQDASGKNIHMECSCIADPKPTITWYKGSTLLKENNRLKLKTTQDKDKYTFMLDILNFTKDDAGVYKVVAKNAHGEGTANITLNLDAQQKDKDAEKDAEKDKEKKTITLTDKATTKIELDKKRVTFEQKVDSKEKPTAQWFFGNNPLKSGGRYKMDVSQKDSSYYASMQMDEVTTKDAGPYKCVIQTPFGEGVQLMKLSSTQLIPPKVKGDPPKFITKLTSKTFNIGEPMDITLKVAGTEPITTIWYFNDKEIKSSSAANISYERGTARFYMSKVTPKDAGVYTVELKNPVGSEKGSANMIVKEDEKKKQKEEEMQRKEEERKKKLLPR
ncbi:disorganized muscle protein 1, partial [Octopus sinensis]|uniref:Disorganized muscle protein 1 n=1 Tax=Octopus sinensis TaxID=2607531 RepID=A0A6P7U6S1_9MOLL